MRLMVERRQEEAAVIAAVVRWFWRCDRDLTFVEVVERVRERCPSVSPECIRDAFERRRLRRVRARRG
jgi:hypothetical protein